MAEDTHETKIVISGDAKNAVGAFGSVVGALNKVRTAVRRVMRAFGLIGMAAQGIQTLISWYKKLEEWTNRAKVAAQKLREEYEKSRYETAVKKAAAAYEQLNKKIAQALELERKRNQLFDERKRVTRDQNDAKLELSKQKEVAALDPEDPEYEKKKRTIERKYERAESQVRNGRAELDAKAQANRTYSQAAQKDREVRELEKQYQRQQRVYEIADDNYIAARNRAGFNENGYRGEEEDVNKAKEAEKAMLKEGLTLDKIADAIKKAREEAEQLRKIGDEQMKGIDAARTRAEADKLRIDNAEKEDAAQEKREAEKKAADERKKAEDELNRATKEAERQHAQDEKRAQDEENREKTQRANDLEGFASRIDAADGVSGNRLTAMGLGSGVSANGGVASDVKKLVDLLRQDVEANKKSAEKNDTTSEMILGE